MTEIQISDFQGHPQNSNDAPTERFVLDENRDVVDKFNPAGPKSYCPEDSPEDQIHLREEVLWARLGNLATDLIINLQPEATDRWGNTYRLFNKESHAIWRAIYYAICSSPLNTIDPSVSIQNRFDGTLKRQKTGLQEVTSLSLFRDDVERLLRDLYGDIESDALDRVLRATLVIVEEFTQFVRADLWQEHHDAMAWDYIFGIGVPRGEAIHGHDHGNAHKALDNLKVRIREVQNNPFAFSKYTVEFATVRFEEFIIMDGEGGCSENSEISF